MRVLALDISTRTGWALLEGEPSSVPALLEYGVVKNEERIRGFRGKPYPWDYYEATEAIALELEQLVRQKEPDTIVIEETNGSRSRYTQKALEWLHLQFLMMVTDKQIPIVYINTGDWRRCVGATLTKDDKKLNVKVRKLKKAGDKAGLKALGVRGKVGKKHVAVRYANATYGLSLRMKDNDVADALCQGTAYFLGVAHCDGN